MARQEYISGPDAQHKLAQHILSSALAKPITVARCVMCHALPLNTQATTCPRCGADTIQVRATLEVQLASILVEIIRRHTEEPTNV